MRLVILVSLVVTFASASAQQIAILKEGIKNLSRQKTDAPFYFLEPGIDTSKLSFIGAWQLSPSENRLVEPMYKKLKEQAKKIGANAFRLRNFDAANFMMTVEVYFVGDRSVEQNELLKPANIIYLFAGEPNEKTEYYSFEFNGAPKSIKNGTYYKYTLREGEQVKLKKGTVTGTVMWVKWKPEPSSHYLSIHGFYNEPVVKRTTVNESFKTGKFTPIEEPLGRLLTFVLTPVE